MFESESGVYRLLNTITGYAYIGRSTELSDRKATHFRELAKGEHWNENVRKDCAIHGIDAFTFEVIEYADPNALYDLEDFHRISTKHRYNIADSSRGGCGPQSEETRRRISKTKRERGTYISPEHRAKISLALAGHKHNEQARQNIAAAVRRRKDDYYPNKSARISETKSKGTYHTPFGDFPSAKVAAEHADGMHKSTITKVCKNGGIITQKTYDLTKWLKAIGPEVIGKSWLDLGFSYTPKVS